MLHPEKDLLLYVCTVGVESTRKLYGFCLTASFPSLSGWLELEAAGHGLVAAVCSQALWSLYLGMQSFQFPAPALG